MESQTASKKAAGKAALLWRFLKGSKRFYIGAVLCAVAITFLDMLTPQIIRVTVDNVLDSKPLELPAFVVSLLDRLGGVEALRQHLWMVAVAVIAVALVIAVFRYGNMTLTAKASETLVQTMRNQLFDHIQRSHTAFFALSVVDQARNCFIQRVIRLSHQPADDGLSCVCIFVTQKFFKFNIVICCKQRFIEKIDCNSTGQICFITDTGQHHLTLLWRTHACIAGFK